MPIRNFEKFQSTLSFVSHNCAMAIRAYSCAITLSKADNKKIAPSITFELMWFTVQSGLLSLCRVWDRNSLSLKNLIDILEEDFVRNEFEHHNDSSEFYCFVTKVEGEAADLLSSKELLNLRYHRNNFLAHYTGADPNKNNPMFGNDYNFLLDRTISIIDQLQYAFGKEKNGLQKLLVRRLDECFSEWAKLQYKDYMLEYV